MAPQGKRNSSTKDKTIAAALIGAGGVVLAAIVAGVFAIATTGNDGPSPSPSPDGDGPPTSSSSAASPTATPDRQTTGFRRELTDNRIGTKVYSDTQGSASHGSSASIPYGTWVDVKCKVQNTSTMSSVSYWYLVETPPWQGEYAPSDTFANGDTPGQAGSTNVDPAVPDC